MLVSISTIIGSLSILFAISTYTYNIKKDKNDHCMDQISFFRKNIITASDGFLLYLRDKKGNKSYNQPRIRFESLDTLDFFKDQKEDVEEQLKNFTLVTDISLDKNQVSIFNLLEELSIKIISRNTFEDKNLQSIKAPFIEIIESNTMALVILRRSNPSSFSNTIGLYLKWKSDIKKIDNNEIIENFKKELDELNN